MRKTIQIELHFFGFEPQRSCAVDKLWGGDFVGRQHIVTNKLRHRQVDAVMPRHNDEATEAGRV